ncbi:MAG: HTH domain-containing protein [Planctomycetota bacterium]
MSDMPWRDAIIEVLRREGAAMHYTAIAERVVAEGLRDSVGATPAATVNSTITWSLKTEGEQSPFQRVARGEYYLRSLESDSVSPTASVMEPLDTGDELEGPIHAFGMFWDRDQVLWKSSPAILGLQQIGADPVDMSGQRGVYLLYDGREVVYVGRSTERPLGSRLYEHTYDRLRTRWDRFSWFGLCAVGDDGRLTEPEGGHTSTQFITAMEALLIEALEPGQNRRRGDGFSAVEFIQAEDPALKKARLSEVIAELQSRL